MHTHRKIYTGENAGFTLVETLVAITILLIAVLVPMRIASQSIQTAVLAREQLAATHLAQEGIESFIRMRDNDELNGGATWSWYTGLNANCRTGTGCSIEPKTGAIVSCPAGGCQLYLDEDRGGASYYTHSNTGVLSPYKRTVVLENKLSNAEVWVTSTVSWYSSYVGGTISVTERTSLYNQYANN